MATQATDATISVSLYPDIAKRMSISGLLISCVVLLIGTLSFVSTFGLEDKSSIASMALMAFETGLLLLGIFWSFWKPKEVVYVPTGDMAKERSIFFDLKHTGKLTDLVNSGSFPVDPKIKSEAGGNIRTDVILSADSKFAAVQLFQFVPYIYQPATTVHYFTNDVAVAVATLLTKSQLN